MSTVKMQSVGGKMQRIIALRADRRAWRRAGSENRIRTCVAQDAVLDIARVVSSLCRHPVVPAVKGSTPSAPKCQPAPPSTPVVVSGDREPEARVREREGERGRACGRARGGGGGDVDRGLLLGRVNISHERPAKASCPLPGCTSSHASFCQTFHA